MTTKYREMVAGQTLTSTATSYYPTPSGTQAAIHAVSVYNPTAGVVTFNLYKGPAATSATKIASKPVAAGQVLTPPEAINHKLEAGTQLWADGAGLTLNISGVEYVPS